MSELNKFRTSLGAQIFRDRYAINRDETWAQRAKTIVKDVCGQNENMTSVASHPLMSKGDLSELEQYIREFKFIPGGRYIYYAGRGARFFNNCFLFKATSDTREEWGRLLHVQSDALMTGGGVGCDYSAIRPAGQVLARTGGISSGVIPLMHSVNEIGRNVRQGGSRRSAIYASLHWQHGDIQRFLTEKDWANKTVPGTNVTYAQAKELDFDFPAPLDGVNISLNYDDEWLTEHVNPCLFDSDKVSSQRISRLKKWLGNDLIQYLIKKTVKDISQQKTTTAGNNFHPTFIKNVEMALRTGEPNFSFNFGTKRHETLRNAPVSARTQVLTDEGYKPISELVGKPTTLWTGKNWAQNVVFECTKQQTPTLNIHMSNKRVITADPDHEFFVEELISIFKSAFEPVQIQILDNIRRTKAKFLKLGDALHTSFPTNEPDNETKVFVTKVEEGPIEDVYCCNVNLPEHSFMAEGVIISNCGEISSEDDGDVCNLGHINLAAIRNIDELRDVIDLGAKFLICGSIRGEVPTKEILAVREKNRRIGLGLMGLHEWLLMRGYRYEINDELQDWLEVYRDESELSANEYADRFCISRPVGYRAIAPTGTTSLLAGTTSGLEPIYAVAYKRRWIAGDTRKYQLVVDSTAKHLIETLGIESPDSIETAIDLAQDPERRIQFQADIQEYVDHCISSTVNLPAWGSEHNNSDTVKPMAELICKYATRLRGITFYPDGARGGQPITRIPYAEAIGQENVIYEENQQCVSGVCGI